MMETNDKLPPKVVAILEVTSVHKAGKPSIISAEYDARDIATSSNVELAGTINASIVCTDANVYTGRH